MKKTIKQSIAALIGLAVLGTVLLAAPAPRLVFQMRLYEGSRGGDSGPGKVVSSYYLKPLARENVFSDTGISTERKTLMRVFNLTDIKLMTDAVMVLQEDSARTPSQVIVLNGRQLAVRLSVLPGSTDRFEVEVLEEGKAADKNPSLLKTAIVLPEEKSTALGFEDSGGRIYFLSFHRKEDLPPPPPPPVPPETPVPPKMKESSGHFTHKPRLIKRVNPQYPKEAQKAGIQGRVVIEATTDETGSVVEARAVKGPKELHDAAVDAIKQWKYEPYIIDGKPKAVNFTVVVAFNLDKKKKENDDGSLVLSAEKRPKLIKRVNPKYPGKALKLKVQDKVVLEITVDKAGKVVAAMVIDGHPLLRTAAMEAVKQWEFQPVVRDGVKKIVRFTAVVEFKLK
jgi:TonB family protein